MKTIEASAFSIDSLTVVERTQPSPRRGEILIRVKAASLNYRDLAILAGTYMPDLPLPYVPLSDACGVVEALGEDGSGPALVLHRIRPVVDSNSMRENPLSRCASPPRIPRFRMIRRDGYRCAPPIPRAAGLGILTPTPIAKLADPGVSGYATRFHSTTT
ncbi:MAG: alcohol dehydrogenase catalytic domain-containing protein [Betaproteobacteria bacterium]|nr:alcohol dehydrogenase catalytic domain-containing protein [Betaproteobacteria bacterium]